MSIEWQYQVRINLSDEFAQVARTNIDDPVLAPLKEILDRYNAVIKNQYDAFADYCAQAEEYDRGIVSAVLRLMKLRETATDTTLYKWTKDTIDKPGKQEQYATRFTVYADGGKETYAKFVADGLETDLQPLLESGMVTKISKIDTNPANNPQAPAKFQR